MDEAVRKGYFEHLFVVGHDGSDGHFSMTGLNFGGIDLQIDGFTVFGNECGVCGRVGRQSSDVVVDGLAVLAPVDVAELFGDFWCGF